MGYVSNTYLLELAKTLVINPPLGIRNISEKMSILQFPELTPKTWVGRDLDALEAFAKQFDQVVLKILFMMGGDGVIKLASKRPGVPRQSQHIHCSGRARADPGAGISPGRIGRRQARVRVEWRAVRGA